MVNEHIKEIAALADMHFDKYDLAFADKDHAEDGVDLEKFSKLLIEKCIEIARKADNEDKVYAHWAIEQYFKD